ncbi:hypothetical protein BCR37DRAFT_389628 [Protomyces lactucae-debilis]|uniref:3'-5' exonuclease n=1 Tax=Protomyces lactucae-debilis TaxID=2754530 RepID=A0A1Y2EYF4_PROLT|nr:uncharacterized protein BCR37DRAFT_389628 [Protomyces lactucae-debilis]ORY75815.1 hypothetical protein BCR37DRAFT_389628 [Protomyces lactucae-debilis]
MTKYSGPGRTRSKHTDYERTAPASSQATTTAPGRGHHQPRGVATDRFVQKLVRPMALSGKYAGRSLDILYTNDPYLADEFCALHIDKQGCTHVGFDLEHRPHFAPGSKANVALLQFAPLMPALSTTYPVLLYSLYHANATLPLSLLCLLSNTAISKHGVGISGDLRHLAYLELPQECRSSYKELERDVKSVMPHHPGGRSLKALITSLMDPPCAVLKTKRLTMTNWEKKDLSNDEIAYAAMDALCGVLLWEIIDTQRG